jgi:hypothetical protein
LFVVTGANEVIAIFERYPVSVRDVAVAARYRDRRRVLIRVDA